MSKDWTDKLPSLLESHAEAEPEGLWDAVQAGLAAELAPQVAGAAASRRRRVAVWWYTVGASLAAAAAVALAVFLWKPAPEAPVTVSPVPEGRLAQELPAGGEPGQELPGAEPAQPYSAPAGQVPPTKQDVAQTPQPAEPSQPEASRQKEPAPEKTEPAPVIPDQWPQAETPRKRGMVRLSVTSGAYLAQAGVAVSQGYGIPSHPGMTMQTKAVQGGGISVPMLSRNRASTTETSHRQSARLALGVEYAFTPRWSVATGLSYTVLRSDFQTFSGETSASTTRHLYYLGVPLTLQWKALEWNRLSINLSAGPMWETAVAARENTVSYIGSQKASEQEERPSIRDPHWSLNAGVGIQYQLLRYGAVFLQPGLSWHIPGSGAVESWYTAHPLSPEVTFGFKFTF